MTITRYETGPRISQAVVHNGVVYLTGQNGTPGLSVRQQTRETLDHIDRLLEKAGSHKSRILSTTLWLADINDFDAVNEVWESWVDGDNPPARATGEVKMITPDYKVEIIVVAGVCDGTTSAAQ